MNDVSEAERVRVLAHAVRVEPANLTQKGYDDIADCLEQLAGILDRPMWQKIAMTVFAVGVAFVPWVTLLGTHGQPINAYFVLLLLLMLLLQIWRKG